MSYKQPFPKPENYAHADRQNNLRHNAADLSPFGVSNYAMQTFVNEEASEFAPFWPTSFHKGLEHDIFGAPAKESDFKTFFEEINHPKYVSTVSGKRSEFPVPALSSNGPFYTTPISTGKWKLRHWESPLAGHQFDIQGPPSSAVAMAPAPRLGSDELAAEMAEIYGLAVLRDVNFTDWETDQSAQNVANALGEMEWFHKDGEPLDADGDQIDEVSRQRRKSRVAPRPETMFRGSSAGCHVGPYISQFMYHGNDGRGINDKTRFKAKDGRITWGAQTIDQRVYAQKPHLNFMTDWGEWLDVQNGADTKDEQLFSDHKFITTPRDLATYVHFDALYQAYLNACLLMLDWKVPFESGFPEGNDQTRDAFATFGGPHILTLVTETATRSLKAVRRQKYNFHLRARPEMVAAVSHLFENGYGKQLGESEGAALAHFEKLASASSKDFDLLSMVDHINHETGSKHFKPTNDYKNLPEFANRNLLLPMAFPEGSPMHPAYGAGHATVAGSCVTVLKAFFEMFDAAKDGEQYGWKPKKLKPLIPHGNFFLPNADGSALEHYDGTDKLTLEGELNKLAANISIGRNMAGVHYFSDYFDSLRMGERIAVGILYEQMTTYTEAVTMRFTSFDDDQLMIKGDGLGGAQLIINGCDKIYDVERWWTKHQGQPRQHEVSS